jgi:hypothetical protein
VTTVLLAISSVLHMEMIVSCIMIAVKLTLLLKFTATLETQSGMDALTIAAQKESTIARTLA